uniref:Putative transmembrane protein n=1 Tax=Toxoplasma gondii COUG TaxID=1074873 RepID=A0A2G8YBM6_TOXGO|nr:putative transmembrane protein [Toxoplasma gondii COUG]
MGQLSCHDGPSGTAAEVSSSDQSSAERRSLSPRRSRPVPQWRLCFPASPGSGNQCDTETGRVAERRNTEETPSSVHERLRGIAAKWTAGSSRCFCLGLHVVPHDVFIIGLLILLIMSQLTAFIIFWVGSLLKADSNVLDREWSVDPARATEGHRGKPMAIAEAVAREIRTLVVPYSYSAFLTLAATMPVFVIAAIYFLFYRGLAPTALNRHMHSVPVINMDTPPRNSSPASLADQKATGEIRAGDASEAEGFGAHAADSGRGHGASDGDRAAEAGQRSGPEREGSTGGSEESMNEAEKEAVKQEARQLPLQMLVYIIYGVGFTISIIWMVCSHIPKATCQKCEGPTIGQRWLDRGSMLSFVVLWALAFCICPTRDDIRKRHQMARRMRQRLTAYRSLASLETELPSSSFWGVGTPGDSLRTSLSTVSRSGAHQAGLPVYTGHAHPEPSPNASFFADGKTPEVNGGDATAVACVGSVRDTMGEERIDENGDSYSVNTMGGGGAASVHSVPYLSPLARNVYDRDSVDSSGRPTAGSMNGQNAIELQETVGLRGLGSPGTPSGACTQEVAKWMDGGSVRVIGRSVFGSRVVSECLRETENEPKVSHGSTSDETAGTFVFTPRGGRGSRDSRNSQANQKLPVVGKKAKNGEK